MKVSTVTAVYNEENNIPAAIENLANQTIPPDEAVFVDDGSTDKTAKLIENYSRKYSWIKLIKKKENVGRWVWFEGYKAAKGPIIVVYDADSIPPKNWIEEIRFKFDDSVGLVGGTCIPKSTTSTLPKLEIINSELLKAVKDRLLYKIYAKTLKQKNVLSMAGTNMAFRKDIVEQEGMLPVYSKYGIDRKLQVGFAKSNYAVRNLQSVIETRYPTSIRDYIKRWIRFGKAEPCRNGLKLKSLLRSLLFISTPALFVLFFSQFPRLGVIIFVSGIVVWLAGSLMVFQLLNKKYSFSNIALYCLLQLFTRYVKTLGYLEYFLRREHKENLTVTKR